MRLIILLATLATRVLALPTNASVPFAKCEEAHNCEVIRDESGAASTIRFKRGMEPGTEHYENHVAKRAGETINTEVTLSDNKVEYGCLMADQTIDINAMVQNLGQVCMESGSCIEDKAWTKDINYVEPSEGHASSPPSTQTWQIKGEGQYPTALRNGFVFAISAVAATQPHTYQQSWAANYKDGGGGSCTMYMQTDYINVARYVTPAGGGEQVLQGFMTARISLPHVLSGWCGFIGEWIEAGAVAGAIPAVGGGIAAIFGTIVAACNMNAA